MTIEDRLRKLMGENQEPAMAENTIPINEKLQFKLDLSSIGDFWSEDFNNEINKLL